MSYKYCRNCGTANKSENRFCEECGSVLAVAAQPSPMTGAPAGVATVSRSSSRKVIIIPIIIAALLLIGGGVFAYLHFFNYKTIDLVKDFDASVLNIDGYDGDAMINDIDRDRINELLQYNDATEEEKTLINAVRYEYDCEDDMHLYNGDKVVITAKFDEEYAEQNKLKIKNAKNGRVKKTVIIENLTAKAEDESADSSYQTPNQTPYEDHDVTDTTRNDYSSESDDYEDEKLYNDDGAYYKVSEERLTADDVSSWDYTKVQTWINYIYTKHGYKIGNTEDARPQREHFETMDWYNNRTHTVTGKKGQKICEQKFTEIEKANKKVLVKRRDEIKK